MKRKKKILIIMDSLTCGGAEKSLISLLPFLAERNYDLTLMLRARGGLFEQYVPENVKIADFPYNASKIGRLLYSVSLRMPWNKHTHTAEIYWRSIGKHFPALADEYDVAIAYQQGFPTFFLAEKVKAGKKICWINADLLKAGYSPVFCKPFYSKYDRIVAVSNVIKDTVVYPFFTDQKSQIFTCLDILNEGLIKDMSLEYEIEKPRKNQIHITTVGRLVPPKGYDLAISSAKILKDRGHLFVWHIVGGGELHAKLKELIKELSLQDYVILEGEKLNPYPYIAAANIYVQTSKFEGFGITIGEAKILGKAILSTNFPVVYEQITDGRNGIVVEMTPKAIADGIESLIKNPELMRNLIDAVSEERNTTAETESKKVISLIED